MDRAKNLPKVGDAERESIYGYVYAVSGPGEQFCAHSITEALFNSFLSVMFIY